MFIYEILPFLNAREGPAASAPAAKKDALVVEPTVSVVVVPETGVSCHSLKRNGTRDKMNAKIQSCLFFSTRGGRLDREWVVHPAVLSESRRCSYLSIPPPPPPQK